jgi:hypothetical protein
LTALPVLLGSYSHVYACIQKYLYNVWSEVSLFQVGGLVLGALEIWFGTLSEVCGSFYLGKSMCTADLGEHYLIYAAYTR